MIKSILYITLATSVLSFGTAHAQSFTYDSTNTETKVIGGVGPNGNALGGSYVEGNITQVYADGKTDKGSYVCVSMANPATSKLFDAHMSCDATMPDGTYSVVLGCNMIEPDGSEMGCVGGMKGKTGAYKGKNGNFSQHAKDDKSVGSGQWFEK